ncbi:uncharacterized protein G2W53_024927 [Senna tora]|uniref:Uncharacterized protein n=1 Tax=Senna tora TaxID=362788 RepID=A0A834WE97_9FABA|nr:uncharacterized protein G2W53_024927 [Senna tora]
MQEVAYQMRKVQGVVASSLKKGEEKERRAASFMDGSWNGKGPWPIL